MGEQRGNHKTESVLWNPVPGDPRHHSVGYGIAHALQHGGWNFGKTLALPGGGGRSSHPG